MFKDTLKTKHDIKDLLQCILDNDIASTYYDILSACIIFITLQVTVATAERSFSKLKTIKNYLRNSISQDRLTNISILNIERNSTKELAVSKLIDDFSNKKARKHNFLNLILHIISVLVQSFVNIMIKSAKYVYIFSNYSVVFPI